MALLWLARRHMGRGPLAGLAFFLVTPSPVLGFVDYGYMQFSFAADRFQYLAGIGVMAVLVGAAVHGVNGLPTPFRMAGGGACIVVLVLLETLTWRQSGVYRNEITFFSHIVAQNPQARDAHLNLGSALFDADRLEEGLAASLVAVEQRPDAAGAHANLGRALLLMDRFDQAGEHLARALELDPRNETAQQNMAELRRKQGRHEEADEDLQRARKFAPHNTAVLQKVAEMRRKQGRFEEALQAYRAVLAIDPEFAMAHAGMGDALFRLERYEKAVDALDRSVTLHPYPPTATARLVLMGSASRALGRRNVAVGYYERGVEMDPRNAEPLDHLAMMRFEEKRFGEALELYRTLLEVQPESAQTHSNLGSTLYYLNRPEDALRSFERALSLDPDLETARSSVERLRQRRP